MTLNDINKYQSSVLLVLIGVCCAHESAKPNRHNEFYGGIDINITLAPYIAHVNAPKSSCTGSIIALDWVLTAAHCLYGVNDAAEVTVYAGIDKTRRVYVAQVRKGRNIILHPERIVREVDLALIQVVKSFRLSDKVAILPIAGDPWPRDQRQYRRLCTTVGWAYAGEKYKKLHSATIFAEHGPDACQCLVRIKKKRSVCLVLEEGLKKGLCGIDPGEPLVCDGKCYAIETYRTRKSNCHSMYRDEEEQPCAEPDQLDVFTYLCPELHWIGSHVHSTPIRPMRCALLSNTLSRGSSISSQFLNQKLLAALIFFEFFLINFIDSILNFIQLY